MKPKRFTRNIHNRQDYCEFEVKNCPYKDIYGLEKYSELEENVDCDLSIAIDKLGEHEDIEQELGVDLVTLVKAFRIIEKKEVNTRFLKQMLTNEGWVRYETYQDYLRKDCKEFKNAYLSISLYPLKQEEFELLKKVFMRSKKGA